jgi:hypothetical protein
METHLALIGGEEFSPRFEEVYASLLADLASILGEEFNPRRHTTGEPALGRHQPGELAGRESV